MGRILITRRIPDAARQLLEDAGHEVQVGPGERAYTRPELLAAAKGVDGLISLLSETINEEVMDAAGPSLRVIANYAVGFDNIDLGTATRRGVFVTNTPDVLTDATADLAWALLLAAARRIPEADRYLRANASTGFPGWNGWNGWSPQQFLGAAVAGRTIGIVGAGRIGTEVARRAFGFKMRILYYSRRASRVIEDEFGGEKANLETLLRTADFICLHVPLIPETHHLIGGREIEMMKPTAVLINTSRGPVVDEKALVCALRTGSIAAAGLDVFENEPEITPGLAGLPSVVVTPHIGSATVDTRSEMARMAANNVITALAGHTPPNVVNRDLLAREETRKETFHG